jgi:hypothetical protein
MRLKPILNRWQFLFTIQPHSYSMYGYELSFGLGKFTSLPREYNIIESKHHRGIFITITLHPPFFTYRRRRVLGMWITYPTWFSFKIPHWIRIW